MKIGQGISGSGIGDYKEQQPTSFGFIDSLGISSFQIDRISPTKIHLHGISSLNAGSSGLTNISMGGFKYNLVDNSADAYQLGYYIDSASPGIIHPCNIRVVLGVLKADVSTTSASKTVYINQFFDILP